jgi:hypothetical protein
MGLEESAQGTASLFVNLSIIPTIRWRRVRTQGHLVRMRKGEMHTGIVCEKIGRKRQFGRPMRRRNVNIKMDLQEIRRGGGVYLFDLAQNRDMWPVFSDTVKNFRFHKKQ